MMTQEEIAAQIAQVEERLRQLEKAKTTMQKQAAVIDLFIMARQMLPVYDTAERLGIKNWRKVRQTVNHLGEAILRMNSRDPYANDLCALDMSRNYDRIKSPAHRDAKNLEWLLAVDRYMPRLLKCEDFRKLS